MKVKPNSLESYLSLKYPVSFYPDSEGGYAVAIEDLPGCVSQGETLSEAMENIQDAKEAWIETAYECGDEIPLSSTETEYSGKLTLKIPKSLHRSLAEKAEREGASLDQYILVMLSQTC